MTCAYMPRKAQWAFRTKRSSRASCEMRRSPRLANKVPVMENSRYRLKIYQSRKLSLVTAEVFCDRLKGFWDDTGENLELQRYLPSTHFKLVVYVNFQEAQRIFPSVPHFARKTTEDCQLGK